VAEMISKTKREVFFFIKFVVSQAFAANPAVGGNPPMFAITILNFHFIWGFSFHLVGSRILSFFMVIVVIHTVDQ
jgi:hypothetical protein